MNLNPPRQVRIGLYLTGLFGTPTVLYLSSTERISDALAVMLGSYIAILLGLAGVNAIKADR